MATCDGGKKFVCSRLLTPTVLNWGSSHTTAGQESERSDTTQVLLSLAVFSSLSLQSAMLVPTAVRLTYTPGPHGAV